MDTTLNGNQINGKAIADMYARSVKHQLADFQNKLEETGFPSRPPVIVSFANEEDPASVKYTEMKQAKAEELGIQFNINYITPKTPIEEVEAALKRYNQMGSIDGIMFQLPITPNLSELRDKIIAQIVPDKDVDGLTLEGQKFFLPATVEGVFQIMSTRNHQFEGKVAAVVGSEGEIGIPLCRELEKAGFRRIIKVDTKLTDSDITRDLLTADYVFSATGVRDLVKAEYLKTGVIVFDIGLGDIDPSVYEIAAEYTPMIGGCGPNTVVALMRNVVKSFINRMEAIYRI